MNLLLVFARRYPRRTLLTMLCLLLAGLAEGVGVSSFLPLIRFATPGAQPDGSASLDRRILGIFDSLGLEPTPHTLFFLVVAGLALKAVLSLVANRQVGYAVAHMATTLRLDLIRALLAARWEYYVHQPMGAVANSVALEARSAAEAYLRATSILAFLLNTAIYAIVAALVSWQATVGALLGGAVIVVVLGRLVRMARLAGRRQTKRARTLLARLTDTLQVAKALKAMAREPLITPLLEGETHALNRAIEREVVSGAAIDSLQEPLIFLFLASGMYVALTFLQLPLADMVVLVFLCARVLGGVGKVQKEVHKLAARESAYWSLCALIEKAQAAVEVLPGGRIPTLNRGIQLIDVGFAYEEESILREASLVIPAGSLAVITGASGAGKTTVADLIIGLLQPTAGRLLIDDVPLPELDARRWREMIGYVPQETPMLHESIERNITLGDPDLSRDDVVAALQAAGAWAFISQLPEGLDTVVGERGMRLSGGQRQRLALARALVRKPLLLVLDEATTALDPATERSVCETLFGLRDTMTVIAICHHGYLPEVADYVYRVSQGCIQPVRAPSLDVDQAAGA